MILRASATAFAVVSSFLIAAVASASPRKSGGAGTISGSIPKNGTLVAMGGSGSLGGSSGSGGSYLSLEILPFQYLGLKTTVKNTTVETPRTTITTMPKTLDFYGRFGSYTVRPGLSLEAGTPSNIGLGFNVSSSLEVGAYLSYGRTSEKDANKNETVDSSMTVGPQAYYFTEFAGFPMEAEARFLLISNTAETTKDSTTTKTKDQSGTAFEVKAKLVKELSPGLEYFGGVGVGYTSITDKSNKDNEITISGMALGITPAGLRYSF
ncbi:MAG: hypothetical protein ACO3A4_13490 [Silvanigrellaceae bacterium]